MEITTVKDLLPVIDAMIPDMFKTILIVVAIGIIIFISSMIIYKLCKKFINFNTKDKSHDKNKASE